MSKPTGPTDPTTQQEAMNIFGFFKRRPRVVLDHPVFGRLTLKRGRTGPFWMHDAYDEEALCIAIATREALPPSDAQVGFFRELVGDPDRAFGKAAGQLAKAHREVFARPLPEDWRTAFRLCSIGIPLDGLEAHPWDIAFECLTEDSGYIFTCHFERGLPADVSVDR